MHYQNTTANVKKWLKYQPLDYIDPLASDLIEDMRGDEEMHKRFVRGADAVDTYLLCRGACREAREGAKEALNLYHSWLEGAR
jgi:hypothetical protein